MKRTIEFGYIKETLDISCVDQLSSDAFDAIDNYLTGFCIDKNANVRPSRGIVNSDPAKDDETDLVPSFAFNIESSPWHCHGYYLEIELPNPATEMPLYLKIREAFINEITLRLGTDMRSFRNLAA